MNTGKPLRKTRIVCTVGPAVNKVDTLVQMIHAGMSVARFNFSHGDHDVHRQLIRMVRDASRSTGIPVALLADTKGPEIRTGNVLNNEPIQLQRGKQIRLTTDDVPGTAERLSISYGQLPQEVIPGTRLLIADGLIELEVLETGQKEMICLIHSDGTIGAKKNVNVIGVRTGLPAVSEKDRADLEMVMEEGMDFVAASFVRKATDIHEIQQQLESCRRRRQTIPPIIAKIEDEEGLANIDEIIRISSGVMVARGDLGVQMPPEEIPLIQKRIIEKCNRAGKVVIVATQMLDSMIRNPLPTRAEVTDVANAILDGTDAVMLSGETAQGRYPVEAVTMMHRIALETEQSEYRNSGSGLPMDGNMHDGIAASAVMTASSIGADAIIAPTYSGNTPKLLFRHRPQSPIVAVTPFTEVQRRLLLHRGVFPIISPEVSDTDTMIRQAVAEAQKHGFVKPLDKYVLAAGMPIGSPIMLNTVRVEMLAEVIAHGLRGFGTRAHGTVLKAANAREAADRLEVDGTQILVIEYLDESFVPLMARIAGYVVEHFSSIPFETLSRNNPALVGVAGAAQAYDVLADGDAIVLDGQEKLVLKAPSSQSPVNPN